jgi:hypothetical protein
MTPTQLIGVDPFLTRPFPLKDEPLRGLESR